MNTQLAKILRKSVRLLRSHAGKKRSKDETLDDVAGDGVSSNEDLSKAMADCTKNKQNKILKYLNNREKGEK